MSWDLDIKRSVIYGMVDRVLYDMNHGVHNNGFTITWSDYNIAKATFSTKADYYLDELAILVTERSALDCIRVIFMSQSPVAELINITANLDSCAIDEYFGKIAKDLPKGGCVELAFDLRDGLRPTVSINIDYGNHDITFAGTDFKQVIDWVDEYFMVGA